MKVREQQIEEDHETNNMEEEEVAAKIAKIVEWREVHQQVAWSNVDNKTPQARSNTDLGK